MRQKNIFLKAVLPGVLIALIILSAFLLTALLTACSPEKRKTELIPVSIGLPTQLPSLLTFIAAEKGYFREAGLDAAVTRYPSGRLALEGMLRGEVEIATTAEIPVVFQSFVRDDFTIFSEIGRSDNTMRVIARTDHNISQPRDLKGKRVASQGLSAAEFFYHLFLLEHGLFLKDVKYTRLLPQEMPDALINGTIDAFVFREPFIGQARRALPGKTIIFTNPGLYTRYEVTVVRNDVPLREEVTRRFLAALLAAEKFAAKNPEDAISIAAQFMDSSEEEIHALWQDLTLELNLGQGLLFLLEDEGRWAIKNKLTNVTAVPEYRDYISSDAIRKVKPPGVMLIQ